jgi:hypothetical protein
MTSSEQELKEHITDQAEKELGGQFLTDVQYVELAKLTKNFTLSYPAIEEQLHDNEELGGVRL